MKSRSDGTGPAILKPVRWDGLHKVNKREIEQDYSRFDLSPEAQMIYPAEAADGTGIMMANMTLFAPNGHPIVLMERFEGLTTAVDCSIVGDGFIGLMLRDQKGYDHAREAWDRINHGDDDEFILITDHEECSPGDGRKAYQ